MRIWPVVIDRRPDYLCEPSAETSLLMLPLGADSVAGHVRELMAPFTRMPLMAIAPHAVGLAEYRRRLPPWYAPQVCAPDAFGDFVTELDPSDTLLVVDASCLPAAGSEIAALIDRYGLDVRVSHHLVAYDRCVGGTVDRVRIEADGRVRGIQRHYEAATWPFISGVSVSVMSAAAASVGSPLALHDLAGLRCELARRSVPTCDVPTVRGVFRLDRLSGLLAANEHFVLAANARNGISTGGPIRVGDGQLVDPAARVIGPVVVHAGARIDAHATIVGPATVGAGAHVGANAVVAHAAIGDEAVVPPGAIVQDTAWLNTSAGPADAPVRPAASFTDRLARLAIHTPPASDPVTAPGRGYAAWKRAADAVVAAAALTLLGPILALIALLIWMQRDGSVFYGDEREGLGGAAFKCWKFRTMRSGADDAQLQLRAAAQVDGPHFKMTDDPRVTRLGRFLRASNLDELPQLFNVLVGEMSLVGPRPSPFRENQICVPWRNARISVRPGITGLWQVCRHDRQAGDFHQWIEYDLLYVQNLSARLDLKILIATLLTLGGKATHVRASTLLPRRERSGTEGYAIDAIRPAAVS